MHPSILGTMTLTWPMKTRPETRTPNLATVGHRLSARFPRLGPLLADIRTWAEVAGATVGLTGSALGAGPGHPNDVDLLLVVPRSSLGQAVSSLWSRIAVGDEHLAERKSFAGGEVDVLGLRCPSDPRIHLEIYSAEAARRVLRLSCSPVSRLKPGPARPKNEVYWDSRGGHVTRPIVMTPVVELSFSVTMPCLVSASHVLVGMHLERLLVAQLLRDPLGLSPLQRSCWRSILLPLSTRRLLSPDWCSQTLVVGPHLSWAAQATIGCKALLARSSAGGHPRRLRWS